MYVEMSAPIKHEPSTESFDNALRAISHPMRRQILHLVWDRERSAGEISSHFAVTRPAISQHLRVLAETGLLSERRSGTHRLYRARPQAVAAVVAFLQQFWSESDLPTA